jgi:hypothetical protein
MADKTIATAVEDLQEGDLVDLEGDKFADPHNDCIGFEYEYEIVDSVDKDWSEDNPYDPEDTTFVNFNRTGQVGFPRAWEVPKVVEE